MIAPLPRILLIEPQFVLRRTIAMVARDLGVVNFHEASSVARGRTLLAETPFAGMVLDLAEETQAKELLGDLRQGKFSTPWGVPVIVLTHAERPFDGTDLQSLSGVKVLTKPVRISELISAIANVATDEHA